jgi:hypothetical protein
MLYMQKSFRLGMVEEGQQMIEITADVEQSTGFVVEA